jgi:hypothetical protein
MARKRETGGWEPTSRNEAVSELVASTNRSHLELREYDSPFIASPTGGTTADAEGFIAALRHCADLIEALGDEPYVMADVYTFLYHARFTLARLGVPAWVVTKHYSSGDMRPAEWAGCLTAEQAEQIAEATQLHYARKYPHLTPDTFVASRGHCNVNMILRPDVTAREYVEYLNR